MKSQVRNLLALQLTLAGLPLARIDWVLADEVTMEGYYKVQVASVAEVFKAEAVAERFQAKYGHEVLVAF
jgi:hypothetical protein